MEARRIVKVFGAITAAAFALAMASGASATKIQDDFFGCMENTGQEPPGDLTDRIRCCKEAGGDWVEIYDGDGNTIDGFCNGAEEVFEEESLGSVILPGGALLEAQPAAGLSDTTAPETNIVTSPAVKTKLRDAAFTFSSTESATFECSLDGADPAPCAASVTFTRIRKGGHSLTVTAIDAAGNRDATPASVSWTVTGKKHRGRR